MRFTIEFEEGLKGHRHIRHNPSASAAPLGTDDETNHWTKGSMWIYDGTLYICIDPTTGSAEWLPVGDATHDHDSDYAALGHDHDSEKRRVVMRPNISNPPEPVSNVDGTGWVYMEVGE